MTILEDTNTEFDALLSKFDPADHIVNDDPFDAAGARGRYKRPKVRDRDGELVERQNRPSSLAKTLDKADGLIRWGQGMAVLGVIENPDLADRVARLDLDGDGWKRQLYDLGETAKESASVNQGADYGSLIHQLTAAVDRGDDPAIPDEVAGAVAAYTGEMARLGLHRTHVEFGVDNPAFDAAGTCDGLWETPGGRLLTGDIKTSKSLAVLACAIQLGLYATSDCVYDPATEQRTPWPKGVDQNTALIIHIKYWDRDGEDSCTVYEVDLAQAVSALVLAMEVEEFRRSERKMAEPVLVAYQVPALTIADRIERLTLCGYRAEAAEAWRAMSLPPVKGLDETTIDAAEKCLDLLEARFGVGQVAPADWRARLRRLPDDLATQAKAVLQWNTKTDEPTPEVMGEMASVLTSHETDAATRVAVVNRHLADVDEPTAAAALSGRKIEALTGLQAAEVCALVNAHTAGLISLESYGWKTAVTPDGYCSGPRSKKTVLDAGRRLAKRHNYRTPKTAADVVKQAILFALVADELPPP